MYQTTRRPEVYRGTRGLRCPGTIVFLSSVDDSVERSVTYKRVSQRDCGKTTV